MCPLLNICHYFNGSSAPQHSSFSFLIKVTHDFQHGVNFLLECPLNMKAFVPFRPTFFVTAFSLISGFSLGFIIYTPFNGPSLGPLVLSSHQGPFQPHYLPLFSTQEGWAILRPKHCSCASLLLGPKHFGICLLTHISNNLMT